MILTKNEINKALKEGLIKITPSKNISVGPGSIDLSLGNELRIFRDDIEEITINEKTNYEDYTTSLKLTKKGYLLHPGELILGITKEKLTLPENICGWIHSRSRFARLGLMSHITAPFISPGVSNRTVLEIYNAGQIPLRLIPDEKICQVIFEKCEGKAKYSGRFKDQKLR
ncbi:dCTP deaminase [Candidatus Woesearchaeota archaeon]|nr:dCTP deaminase [Candidatus Woesearchaeota archaeon]